jgi:hypothetical protein
MTEKTPFDSWQEVDVFLFSKNEIDPGAEKASYLLGTGDAFHVSQAVR